MSAPLLEPMVTPFVKRESRPLKIVSDYAPAGDQPQAITELTDGCNAPW